MLVALVAALPLAAQVVREDNFSNLKVHYQTPTPTEQKAQLCGRTFFMLDFENYVLDGTVGDPALPTRHDIIAIPFCSRIEVKVENARFDTIDVATDLLWLPQQPPRSKSDRSTPYVVINDETYATDSFTGTDLVKVEDLGIARDRRLARLSFSPVSVNPATGRYAICRSADVTIAYIGADSAATVNHYETYQTPAFSSGQTLNKLFSSAKAVRRAAPVRMVIMAPSSLQCKRLNDFVEWKRSLGYWVDFVYTDSQGLNSNTAIANYLQNLYNNATFLDPAPTYLIIVGDHTLIPAFNSRLTSSSYNGHITDLYFSTWTSGDILPDCYYGRLSATDTATLANIINKTILYESYNLPDINYLARATLIAGVDQSYTVNTSDNAYTYADPTMDYIASTYVKGINGFTDVAYYKNDTEFAPSGVSVTGSSRASLTASRLKTRYNNGSGWINYSAHGDWDEWSIPAFTVSDANTMTNQNMPSVMIGNCCLSNKFDKTVCFGESLTRLGGNAGAVAYIGASDYTYWAQDFYWSVGLRSNISGRMNAQYNASNLGTYDRLFHTHSEAYSDQASSMGSIVYGGNMAVNSSSSSQTTMIKYYWEVYHLLGDPSLKPWLGKASELHLSVDTTSRNIRLWTVAHAYVALVDSASHNLLAATFIDENGSGTLKVSDTVNLSKTYYVVTAQGYVPYFSKANVTGIDPAQIAIPIDIYPNPATDYCIVKAADIKSVRLLDLRGAELGSYQASEGQCKVDLTAVPEGVYLVAVETSDSVGARKLIIRK